MKTTMAASMLALGLMACKPPATATATPRPPVEVAVVTVKAQTVAINSELPGRTVAAQQSEVRPQVTGIVRRREFVEGALVKAGQRLFQIDPAPYRASLHEAEANLKNAEAVALSARLTAERYTELLPYKGVSQQDADLARAALLQAEANVALYRARLETAQLNLDYTEVRAPIGGRIGTSAVTAGALVTANQDTALATIIALDPMYVDLTQSSAELLKLRRALTLGQLRHGQASVRLTLEDGSAYAPSGSLQLTEVAVDPATGSVLLRAEFANPDGYLLPGMFVRAEVEDAVVENAILAPQRGVQRNPRGEPVAYVVNAQQQVELRALSADRTVGNQWLISGGLEVGDRLIVEGLNKITAGATVRAVDVSVKDAQP